MKLIALAFFTSTLLHTSGLTPIELQVENEANPVGVTTTPRLSWKLDGSERGTMQTGYAILAASTPKKLAANEGDLWTSKESKNSQRRFIPWEGKALKEGQIVHWKVTITDNKNQKSFTSKPAQFTVGKRRRLQAALQIGTFESDHDVLNAIFQRNLEALKSRLDQYTGGNDSGLGTGHQVQRSARDLMYLFDAGPALTDWTRKIHESQNELGLFPGGLGKAPSITNSDAAVAVPHALWWMSGDPSFISASWKTMEQFMIRREKNDPSLKGRNWGSPLTVQAPMTPEFVDLCYFGMSSRLMYEMAAPAEEPNQSIRFKDYQARVRSSFKEQYLGPKGTLKIPGQSAAILALRSSVMDAPTRQPVLDALIESLPPLTEIDSLVAKPLLPVLTLTGNQQKAFEIVSNPMCPWADPKRPDFLASGVAEWIMSSLAGIQSRNPGFGQFRIAPQIPDGDSLTWVKASYNAPSGKVSIHWEKKEGHLHFWLNIPSGSLAQLSLPFNEGQKISEGGKTVQDSYGIAEMSRDSTKGIINILAQSGKYHFVIQ